MRDEIHGLPSFGHLHEHRTVARVGGSMMLAGGGISVVLGLVDPNYDNGHPEVVFTAAGIAIAIGLLCTARSEWAPRWLLYMLPTFGTLLISMSILLSRTPTDGSEILLLWPVLFAGYFLPRPFAWLNVVVVVGSYTPVAVWILGQSGLTPSVILACTSVITLLIVAALRARLNELLVASHVEARTDGLTGLPNRRAFDEAFTREAARCARHHTPLALMMIDLDNFKLLNDTAGHPAGDAALARVAELLSTQIRQSDLLARFGGEEFALLLPDCPVADAVARAEHLRRMVQHRSRRWPHALTVSIGVAAMPAHAESLTELLAAADGALYAAKGSGRNAVRTAADLGPQSRAEAQG